MRIKQLNYKFIGKIIGFLIILEGLLMAVSLVFSFIYGSRRMNWNTLFNSEHDILAITLSAIITIVFGVILLFKYKKADTKQIGKREAYLTVFLCWFFLALFGVLPYIFTGIFNSFTDAFFESMSGFTTTGFSLIKDVETLPKGIILWRSITNWLGGMGMVFMTLAFIPVVGGKGGLLFAAETSNEVHDKVHPRINVTAKRLWTIYFMLTLACFGMLLLGKMSIYDSVCTALSTVSTGGFSHRNAGLADQSPYIHYVIIVFIIIAATSFNLHYLFLRFQWKKVFKNEEFRVYMLLIILCTVFVVAILALNNNSGQDAETIFRQSLFHVSSMITTAGFAISDYSLWPGNIWIILFLLTFMGGCAGSTTGGIKIYRHIIMFKNCKMELKRLLHPQAVIPVRYNGNAVSQNTINNTLAFFYFFILITFFASAIICLSGIDFMSAISVTVNCLSNTGSGIGSLAGPGGDINIVHGSIKWLLSFLMITGRLEIFTVFVILNKTFWKK
ncbi:TrkH family potassium uptake protein [Bacteroidales bacterium OttesenSCG-928-K03]|nr:TrkH family potassium uptake protein [Odoribacter sp. OttesenSCG-928-L07]MDL2242159.1 TrkH family potassium uptake protein [Bacteroidales bacterium OttesenSCG-928-K03]